ncbi:right-handed parallel beta-helix repeat-containing protein [Sphingomonas sp. SUN019]|uniref:right-handed parallel beta-helix repeat-containing protein n=1 Tax=Sphingomonas sp. SUN019 TaxID=2937788 RepID=UPI002164DAAC|nr:right-handed parallel beta-helix repeat-containing protein [Sphingomonas sp. SUN019]UVO48989.1 right-handed parallel beta-helix repeat-containing protein [Sphingomonas sp. SUN019]
MTRTEPMLLPKRVLPALTMLVLSASMTTGSAGRTLEPLSSPMVERRLSVVDQRTIAAAITDARETIARRGGVNYVIRLPAGTFELNGAAATGGGTIDVSRIDACPGRLTITGAGADRTKLITDDRLVGIIGRATRCVTIADLTMTQRRIEMSQGKVFATTPDAVVLDIPRGFPTPADLMPRDREIGRNGREVMRRWMKKYVDTPTGPQIVVDQVQAMWSGATRIAGAPNRWRIQLVVRPVMPAYRPGDLIGLKSKSGEDSYRFINADRITLRGVRWSVETRGVFRMTDNVRIENCSIVRPAPINGVRWAMASSSGGPQIGQPSDPMTQGHIVVNNDFQATGDDALMFAHANGVARGNRISDTFGSAIRIYESPGLTLSGNVTVRAPILRVRDGLLERPGPSIRRMSRANGVEPDRL